MVVLEELQVKWQKIDCVEKESCNQGTEGLVRVPRGNKKCYLIFVICTMYILYRWYYVCTTRVYFHCSFGSTASGDVIVSAVSFSILPYLLEMQMLASHCVHCIFIVLSVQQQVEMV